MLLSVMIYGTYFFFPSLDVLALVGAAGLLVSSTVTLLVCSASLLGSLL